MSITAIVTRQVQHGLARVRIGRSLDITVFVVKHSSRSFTVSYSAVFAMHGIVWRVALRSILLEQNVIMCLFQYRILCNEKRSALMSTIHDVIDHDNWDLVKICRRRTNHNEGLFISSVASTSGESDQVESALGTSNTVCQREELSKASQSDNEPQQPKCPARRRLLLEVMS